MDKPQLILYNGEIQTIDNEKNVFEAIAVSNGKIIALGTSDEILTLQNKSTKLVDLEKKTVLPGFIEAHQHMFHLGFNLLSVNCQFDSIDHVVQAIKKKADESQSEDEWILGWGFDESLYAEGRKLNKYDFAGIKNPVYVTRYCVHEGVGNERALQLAGITSDTVVKNGIIELDAEGNTTGLLKEKAMELIETQLPPYTNERLKEALRLANKEFVKNGITTIHEAGLGFLVDPYKEFNAICESISSNELSVRTYLMVMADYYEEFVKKNKSKENDKIKLGSMKLFADGTLGGKTAAAMEPYRNSDDRGMLLYSDEELESYVTLAHELDAQVAIHAIGDRAMDQVISVYEKVNEKNKKENSRHRIEHSTLSNDDLLARMQKLGAIPIPQPGLLHLMGDSYIKNVEDKFRGNIVDIKSFLDFELKPAGSSDSPVIDCSPFLGISSAMSRETVGGNVIGDPISLYEAVEMYTMNAAYSGFEEEVKGSLEVGKFGDFVVLPEKFMQFNSEEVKQTTAEMTIVNGEIVYSKAP